MMFSMTGYGRSQKALNEKTITVEIKSLNSKQADISTKIPSQYKSKEIIIRQILSTELERGKIEIFVRLDGNNQKNIGINKNLASFFYDEISEMMQQKGLKPKEENIFQSVLRMPEVVVSQEDILKEAEWKSLQEAIKEAIVHLKEFRQQEGAALKADFVKRIAKIESLLMEIPQFENERIETIRNRIQQNLNELNANENTDVNRFEQEMIYYLEKLDITEEKVRLRNHCKYFRETMEEDKAQGKKLGFISQEIGREINTIGSKANHSEIQKIVVQMKDELEKIKEQLLNIL